MGVFGLVPLPPLGPAFSGNCLRQTCGFETATAVSQSRHRRDHLWGGIKNRIDFGFCRDDPMGRLKIWGLFVIGDDSPSRLYKSEERSKAKSPTGINGTHSSLVDCGGLEV